jgi:hypothetical protein
MSIDLEHHASDLPEKPDTPGHTASTATRDVVPAESPENTPAPLSEPDARELTATISGIIVGYWIDLPNLLREAHDRQAWAAMGYRSWGEYISAEFSGALAGQPRDRKRAVHQELRELGGSTRDIAEITGVSNDTVHRDTRATVSGETVAGHDGRERPATAPRDTEPADSPESAASHDGRQRPTRSASPTGSEVIDAELVDDGADEDEGTSPAEPAKANSAMHWPHVDTDQCPNEDSSAGPTQPATPKPRRKPVGDTALDTGWAIRRDIEKAQRVVADERHPANRRQVARGLRGHLEFAQRVIPELLDQLADLNPNHTTEEDAA